MWRTGFSNDSPNMPSMTIWCESPMPSTKPPAARGLRGQRLVRQHHRVARVGGHHAGAELDARDFASDDGERLPSRRGRRSAAPVRREAVLSARRASPTTSSILPAPRYRRRRSRCACGPQAIREPRASLRGSDRYSLSGSRGRGSAGRASPCQGEGRGFESRRPLTSGHTSKGSAAKWRPADVRGATREVAGAGARRAHFYAGRSCADTRRGPCVIRPPDGGEG